MALVLRALGLLVAGMTASLLAAQVALQIAAWRHDRAREVCRDADERPPLTARLWSVVRETALSLGVVAAWPFGAGASPGPGGARTVVLVHGFATSPASLRILARRLRRDGWTVFAPRLGLWWRDLAEVADRLEDQLRDVHTRHGAGHVIVVAFGLGGLAARTLLAHVGPDHGVRALVTLGTPHGGSHVCAWLPLGALADARPDSSALDALARAPLPRRIDAVAIASPDDAAVSPPEVAQWRDACNVSVQGIGHLGLLVSARVYELIVESLAADVVVSARVHGD